MCPLPVSECFTCTISLDLIAPLWPTEIASDGQGCFPGSTGGGGGGGGTEGTRCVASWASEAG